MIRHEKRVSCASPKLVDDRPERRRAQASLDRGDVAKLAPAEAETDRGVCAMVTVPRFLLQNPEPQAERLHGPDRMGKKTPLEVFNSVHRS